MDAKRLQASTFQKFSVNTTDDNPTKTVLVVKRPPRKRVFHLTKATMQFSQAPKKKTGKLRANKVGLVKGVKQTTMPPLSLYNPSIHQVDPFDSMRLDGGRDVDGLLHHWITGISETRIAMNPRSSWLHYTLHSPVLATCTMVSSASHIFVSKGPDGASYMPNVIVRKLAAIQRINSELQVPIVVPSDAIIGSVSIMALLECMAGTPEACAVHAQGLDFLIKKAGGIRNLGCAGISQRMISWTDSCCATVLGVKPRYDPLLITDRGEEKWPLIFRDPCVEDLRSRMLPFTGPGKLSSDISYIWTRMYQLSSLFSSITTKQTSKLDDCLMSDKTDGVERQILGLIHSEAVRDSPDPPFMMAFLNAGILHTSMVLRQLPRGTLICTILASRVMSSLKDIDLQPYHKACPDVLTWIILTGSLGASFDSPLSVWYTKTSLKWGIDLSSTLTINIDDCGYFDIAQECLGRESGKFQARSKFPPKTAASKAKLGT